MTLLDLPPASESTLLPVLGVTFAALVVGSVVRGIRLRRADDETRRKRLASLRSWWILTLVLAACLLAGRWAMCLALAIASGLAVHEFARLAVTRKSEWRAVYVLYPVIIANYLLIALQWNDAFVAFTPLAALFVLTLVQLRRGATDGYIRSTVGLYWSAVVLVYGLSHAAYVLILPEASSGPAGPAGWFFFLVLLTELNDIAQALVGRQFGRRAIAPTISPNKTWEGFLGGVVVTAGLAVLLAGWLTTLNEKPLLVAGTVALPAILVPALAGVLIAVSGFFGDINMSAVKRDAAVKDAGTLLPGIGGMIDRVDSLTFSAPAFAYFVKCLHT